jgi:Co/Zn/Cd efflux system component
MRNNSAFLNRFGVILAGALVYLTGSKLPDLLVGTIVFVLVARGARRILRPSR